MLCAGMPNISMVTLDLCKQEKQNAPLPMSTFNGYSFEAAGSWIDPTSSDQSKEAIKHDVGRLLPPKPNFQFPP